MPRDRTSAITSLPVRHSSSRNVLGSLSVLRDEYRDPFPHFGAYSLRLQLKRPKQQRVIVISVVTNVFKIFRPKESQELFCDVRHPSVQKTIRRPGSRGRALCLGDRHCFLLKMALTAAVETVSFLQGSVKKTRKTVCQMSQRPRIEVARRVIQIFICSRE